MGPNVDTCRMSETMYLSLIERKFKRISPIIKMLVYMNQDFSCLDFDITFHFYLYFSLAIRL